MPEPMNEKERKAAEARFIRGSTDKSKPMSADRLFFLEQEGIVDFDEKQLELVAEVTQQRKKMKQLTEALRRMEEDAAHAGGEYYEGKADAFEDVLHWLGEQMERERNKPEPRQENVDVTIADMLGSLADEFINMRRQ